MKTTKKDECSYSFSNAIRTLAMEAVIESETEYWLDLLRDVTADDAQYVIDSSVQIDANGYTLTLNALRTRMRASLQYRNGTSSK